MTTTTKYKPAAGPMRFVSSEEPTETFTLVEFILANEHDEMVNEWIRELGLLDVKGEITLGGGAGAAVTIRRVL